MYIEEVEDQIQDRSNGDDLSCISGSVVVSDAKRALLGAGAHALFYPSLFYNVVRNKIQSEFRWWDRVDELILLGAVPFPADVPRLRELGVSGVVTLNEPYETLVPTSLYNLVHGQMAPDTQYEYVRSIRPRVLLASSQWQAVQEYYHIKVKKTSISDYMIVEKYLDLPAEQDEEAFDDDSVVMLRLLISSARVCSTSSGSLFTSSSPLYWGFGENNVSQTWNSQYFQGESEVVVAQPDCSLNRYGESGSMMDHKSWNLLFRSLRSGDRNFSDGSESNSPSMGSSNNPCVGIDNEFGDMDPTNLENRFDETDSFLPIPWRLRSNTVEFGENVGANVASCSHLRPLSIDETQFESMKSKSLWSTSLSHHELLV
ncbi:hypothetical protein Ddye_018266 [Dipteronia dyeriana]|uniref:Dual specificity protein phosphatase DSP8 n=1 Tax=Dipteronia dyeriana TaxID=168575 RepID=A0AAD9X1T7_9ROSI|nr:hypothetical protein Ddye_018266 [Dipteronia dyeriana]